MSQKDDAINTITALVTSIAYNICKKPSVFISYTTGLDESITTINIEQVSGYRCPDHACKTECTWTALDESGACGMAEWKSTTEETTEKPTARKLPNYLNDHYIPL